MRVLGRSPALDGLRAVAVLIVFASHVEAFLPLATLLVVPGGTVGLDRFFVLSGFLITALLLKEQSQYGTIRRWAFYKRRIVRLLPPLFFLLVTNVIFALAINAWSRQQVESLVSVIFYYSNYYQASHQICFVPTLQPVTSTFGRFRLRAILLDLAVDRHRGPHHQPVDQNNAWQSPSSGRLR